MRLVFIYNYFSPAFKAGGPIISLQNLSLHLKDELDIQVICSNKDHDGFVLDVPVNNWTDKKNCKVYYTDKGFHGIRKAAPADAKLFFINGMYSLQFNFLPALLLKGRKIISVRGMLHPEGLLQKSFKKKLYLQVWKFLGLHRTCEYHATSEAEKLFIHNVFGKETKVSVVPNLPYSFPFQIIPQKKRNHLKLCTVALISAMKNHLLVLKALANCTATIEYDIYGSIKDETYWRKCSNIISTLPSNIVVKYHGAIDPAIIPGAIAAAHVYIQPSEAENFGHSLYEALTTGRPVITSNNTPWNNLKENFAGVNSNTNIAEIKSAIDFFAAMDEQELNRWSIHAREYAIKSINIEEIKKQYVEMFCNSTK